ncbi:MAG: hypothetical protein HZC38_09300 [Chloroflexi bacterium]|nr:hypothetical protein [Chloroflexota bacterium]
MLNPFFLMTILFASLAALTALDASLASYGLVTWFNGLRWLRVHFVTLGMLTEMIFGLLPILIATRAKQPHPKVRWDIWLTLNAGLLILLIGIPLVNGALIFVGGTLVFIAASLLIMQLNDLRRAAETAKPSLKFYIAGLIFLLLGIIVGTGLWIGWSSVLQIAVPIEVHIHANNWGFMSLMFAGLLIDLYPSFAKRSLAWERSLTPIFWMMTLGALLLVLGPWFKSEYFSVPGILLHLPATLWLALNVIKPYFGEKIPVGIAHIASSYVWIALPVLVAPLILLKVPGFPGAGIEANAPQALVYGWVLQFAYALIPYLFTRFFLPKEESKLGGNWFSLIVVHLGGAFLWVSIFVKDYQAILHGTAYALWLISMIPILIDLWRITRAGFSRLEMDGDAVSGD